MTKVVPGINDLYSQRPDLMQEWDWEENNKIGLDPRQLTCGSSKKAHWICQTCGNKYFQSIYNKNKGQKCPYCSNHTVSYDKSLAVLRKDLLEEWDYSKNIKDPFKLSLNSHYMAYWICKKCGYRYAAMVYSRAINNTGCRVCAGRNPRENMTKSKGLIVGVNDLNTTHPMLAKQWSSDNTVSSKDFTAGSNKVVIWECDKCGYKWETSISNRTAHGGRGCPACSGKVVTSKNNLKALYPKIAAEFDISKNGKLPEDVLPGSNESVWWQCVNNHHWMASINSRVHGNNCPYCSASGTSYPELFIYLALKGLYTDTLHRHKIQGTEYDIVIPSLNTVIEYNGYAFHSKIINKRDSDIAKMNKAFKLGYNYIEIIDSFKIKPISHCNIVFEHRAYKQVEQLTEIVNKILNILGEKRELNLHNAENINKKVMEAMRFKCLSDESLGNIREDLIDEWDTHRNGKLSIFNIKPYSNKKVWWICKKCGKSYNSSPSHRIEGRGCPYCAGRHTNSNGEY